MIRAVAIQMIFVWAAGSAAPQISATSKLKDFEFERTSPSVLTFGAQRSTRTPCNVRFNQRTHSFTAGGTVVLGGSSPKGMAFAYVTSDGRLSIGSDPSIASCTGCIGVSRVSRCGLGQGRWSGSTRLSVCQSNNPGPGYLRVCSLGNN